MKAKLFFSIVFLMIVSLETLMAQNQPVVAPNGSTVNYVPKFTTVGANPTVISNSLFNDNGTTVGATGFLKIEQNSPYGNFLGYQAGNSNTGTSNVGLGYQALYTNSSGQKNTATGVLSLKTNSTGQYNTANGYGALNANTASENTAIGWAALLVNTSGANNTATGSGILYANTTGSDNTASGYRALFSNTTGSNNTANGYGALYSNTTANNNTANGYKALYSNTIGILNNAFGDSSLYNNTTAGRNIAIGNQALYTQSYSNSGTAWFSNNVAVGFKALYSNQPTATDNGRLNTAIGNNALDNNTTGSYNSAIGYDACSANTTGSSNAGIGYNTLKDITTGSNNTGLGYNANTFGNCSNATALGYYSVASSSNYVRVGNSSVSTAAVEVDWTISSDARIKNNIQQNVPGLDFIKLLKPVTYHLNIHEQNNIMGIADNENWEGKYDIEAIQFTGFIAQQVDSAAQLLGYDFSGVDRPKNPNDIFGLRYSTFVVPLVKAVQEQQKLIDSMKVVLQILYPQETLNRTMQNNIDEQRNSSNIHEIELSNNAVLYQNSPNPFSEGTVIKYFVPDGANVQIVFNDEFGSQLKVFNIEEKGVGQLNISATNLAAGMYSYSLIVNGRVVDTKKMIKQ